MEYTIWFLSFFPLNSWIRVETQDGGDAKIEVSPRDIVYTEPAEPLENEQPVILHKLDFRYGYDYKLAFIHYTLGLRIVKSPVVCA